MKKEIPGEMKLLTPTQKEIPRANMATEGECRIINRNSSHKGTRELQWHLFTPEFTTEMAISAEGRISPDDSQKCSQRSKEGTLAHTLFECSMFPFQNQAKIP